MLRLLEMSAPASFWNAKPYDAEEEPFEAFANLREDFIGLLDRDQQGTCPCDANTSGV